MNTKMFICKARRVDNNEWVTGYYIELNNVVYILPEKSTEFTPIKINADTICRYTGYDDCDNKPVFVNDLIIAGKWKSNNGKPFKEYYSVLVVRDCDTYFGLDIFDENNMHDCLICGCDDDLNELREEYFIMNFGNTDDENVISKAYDFWSENVLK